MDSTTLKYFLTVAETQHMTHAAERLNISQPSLSAAMRRLETEAGVQLFDRKGRNIQLNEYGQIYMKYAEEIYSLMSKCLEEIQEHYDSRISFVRIACASSPINEPIINFLISNDIHIDVDRVADDWEERLANGSCDLVITSSESHNKNLDHEFLRKHEVVAACSRDHPLAAKTSITISELSKYPFCSTGSKHSLLNIAMPQLRSLGLEPRVTFIGGTSNYMRKVIASSNSIGLFVRQNITESDGLVILPIEGFDVSTSYYIYRRRSDSRNRFLSLIYEDIVDFCRSNPL